MSKPTFQEVGALMSNYCKAFNDKQTADYKLTQATSCLYQAAEKLNIRVTESPLLALAAHFRDQLFISPAGASPKSPAVSAQDEAG